MLYCYSMLWFSSKTKIIIAIERARGERETLCLMWGWCESIFPGNLIVTSVRQPSKCWACTQGHTHTWYGQGKVYTCTHTYAHTHTHTCSYTCLFCSDDGTCDMHCYKWTQAFMKYPPPLRAYVHVYVLDQWKPAKSSCISMCTYTHNLTLHIHIQMYYFWPYIYT